MKCYVYKLLYQSLESSVLATTSPDEMWAGQMYPSLTRKFQFRRLLSTDLHDMGDVYNNNQTYYFLL